MENSEFAKIFYDNAKLLELGQENVFRIRAYQRAAQSIENYSGNIESVYKKGGIEALEAIPGIGKSLAEHIEEIIKTGKLKAEQSLFKKFPKTILDVISIPGLGPKTALLLYKKLKIDSIDKLKRAATEGKLMKVPGIRAKKIENILAGIELKKRNIGRFSIGTALPLAGSLVNGLKGIKEIDQIMPCGSLRRGQETIGDIDILITSKKPGVIMDAFVKLPQVDRVLGKGDTKTSVILKNGMEADLRVVEPSSFGSAIHYFTGSKQHNIMIRELAIKKGLKISEYGVFKGNKKIGGKTEEEVFRAVGLPYIPPELRQGRGEFEAAKKNELPRLIEIKDIRGDLHVHTKATDGSNTIEEMAEKARSLGYEYIAITDHSVSTRIAHGLTKEQLLSHIKKIEKESSKLGFRILKGSEVDILPDGRLDYPDEILERLDIVFASVHSNFKMERSQMTKRIITAMNNRHVSVLSHPTGRLIGEREPYAVDLDAVLKAAKDTGTFIELNSFPARLDLDDNHCKAAKDLGVLIAITTDAHVTDQMDNMKYGILTAKRGWLEKKDILNSQPFDKLLKTLALKRR